MNLLANLKSAHRHGVLSIFSIILPLYRNICHFRFLVQLPSRYDISVVFETTLPLSRSPARSLSRIPSSPPPAPLPRTRRRRLYPARSASASPSRVVAAFRCCHTPVVSPCSRSHFYLRRLDPKHGGSICNDLPPLHRQQLHGGHVARPSSSPACSFALFILINPQVEYERSRADP